MFSEFERTTRNNLNITISNNTGNLFSLLFSIQNKLSGIKIVDL